MNHSLKLFLFFTFTLMNLPPNQIFAEKVTIIPVSGFHELGSHIDAFKQSNPSVRVVAMVDCDRALTADYDTDGIHRDLSTSSTLASLASKRTPTLIATARFLTHFDSLPHSESWEHHKGYSVQMLENLGLTFSDQEGQLYDLNLRDESYDRGIFVNRVLYTGHSKKGRTIARFVDKHPFFQQHKASHPDEEIHLFIIDDDKKHVTQPETVTILCTHTPLARSQFSLPTLLNFMYYADSKDKVRLIEPLLQTFFKDPEMQTALRNELKEIKDPKALNAPVVKALLSLLGDQIKKL